MEMVLANYLRVKILARLYSTFRRHHLFICFYDALYGYLYATVTGTVLHDGCSVTLSCIMTSHCAELAVTMLHK